MNKFNNGLSIVILIMHQKECFVILSFFNGFDFASVNVLVNARITNEQGMYYSHKFLLTLLKFFHIYPSAHFVFYLKSRKIHVSIYISWTTKYNNKYDYAI